MAYRSRHSNRFDLSLFRVIQQKRCNLLVPPIQCTTRPTVELAFRTAGAATELARVAHRLTLDDMLPTNQTSWPVVRVFLIAFNTGLIASGWFISAMTRSMRYTSCESIGGTSAIESGRGNTG